MNVFNLILHVLLLRITIPILVFDPIDYAYVVGNVLFI